MVRDKSVKATTVDIDWKQLTRCLTGCTEQYSLVRYSPKGSKGFVQVFVANDESEIPEKFNTSGHSSLLHFGLIYGKDGTGTIFFVLHPNNWGPFQHRFQQSLSTKSLHEALNSDTHCSRVDRYPNFIALDFFHFS